MLDVVAKNSVALLRNRRGKQMRPYPILAFASSAAREVDRVPELGSDKFSGMKIRADHAPCASCQLFRGQIELAQNLGVPFFVIEVRANLVSSHVEDVEQSTVPERLLIQADMRTFIQVHRNSHAPQRQVALRTPRRAWLAVANRSDAKNPAD